jgi:hypothetical protein
MRHPLERHDLKDLEKASIELQSHIRSRRPKPSLARRIIGLCISVPAIAGGLYILAVTLGTGHFFGILPTTGGVLAIGGVIWIYSDWFE